MSSDQAGGSAKSASLWAMAGSLGTRGMSFLFFMLIARALSPAELGVMAMALAVSVFCRCADRFWSVVAGDAASGPDATISQLFSGVLWLQMLLATLGGLAIVAVSGINRSGYDEPRLQWTPCGV